MYFINCLVGGVLLVCTLIHRLTDTHVVSKLSVTKGSSKGITTVSLVVLCVVFPIVPMLMLIVGLSTGVVSILTMGAITTQRAQPTPVHEVEAHGVRLLTTPEYEARVLEDYPDE